MRLVKSETVVMEVEADPDLVMRRVAEQLLLSRRERAGGGPFSVVYQDRRRLTASQWTQSLGLLILLLFLGLIPGIIYGMVCRSRTRLTTVDVARDASMTRVTISGNDQRANKAISRFVEKEFRT
jgi:hypothetical protein